MSRQLARITSATLTAIFLGLVASGEAFANPLFRNIGLPSPDCDTRFPVVYASATVGQPVKIWTYYRPNATVLLAVSGAEGISSSGSNIGNGLTAYLPINSVTTTTVTTDANGFATLTVNPQIPLTVNSEFALQAFAATSVCPSDPLSASQATLFKVAAAGTGAANTIPTSMASSITRNGITITFNQAYPVGNFVSNRPFVVAPNGLQVIATTPSSSNSDYTQQIFAIYHAIGGSFRITVNGQTTAPIPYNAETAIVKSAVEALAVVNSVDVFTDHVQANNIFKFALRFTSTSAPITSNITLSTGALTSWQWGPITSFVVRRAMNGGTTDYVDGENPFDSSAVGSMEEAPNLGFNFARNLVGDISSSSPLTVPPGKTLLVSRSVSDPMRTVSQIQVDDYLSLTVLAGAPPAGSFAPPGSNAPKVLFNVSDINWPLFQNLPIPVGANAPAASSLAAQLNSISGAPYAVKGGYGYRSFIPEPSLNYGGAISALFGEAVLTLNTNITQSAKTELSNQLLQFGIDRWGESFSYREANSNGGHQHGRDAAIFTGAYLGDFGMASMALNGKRYGEMAQYTRVQQSHITRTPPQQSLGWTQSDLNRAAWRMSDSAEPDNFWTNQSYRYCCTTINHRAYILVARLTPFIRTVLNLPEMFEYEDAYQTNADPSWKFHSTFDQKMYDTYRQSVP